VATFVQRDRLELVLLPARARLRRLVVELSPAEFEQLDRACGRVPPAEFLKLVALRLTKSRLADESLSRWHRHDGPSVVVSFR